MKRRIGVSFERLGLMDGSEKGKGESECWSRRGRSAQLPASAANGLCLPDPASNAIHSLTPCTSWSSEQLLSLSRYHYYDNQLLKHWVEYYCSD